MPQGDRRVVFDFAIDFTNGGGIQGQDCRLDIAGEEIDDGALADYIVADLRLLMVGAVHILNKRIIVEPHKRNPMHAPVEEDRFVDLSHTITDGLRTYKGLPAPNICDELSRERRGRSTSPAPSSRSERVNRFGTLRGKELRYEQRPSLGHEQRLRVAAGRPGVKGPLRGFSP